jgi:hypothetical protein
MTFEDLNAQQYEDLALRCMNDQDLKLKFLTKYAEDFNDFSKDYIHMLFSQVSTMFLEWHDDEYIRFGFDKYGQEYL